MAASSRSCLTISRSCRLPIYQEGQTLEEAVSELEMQMIKSALAQHNWNMSQVANELGLTRRGLYLKLARYGIEKAK